MTSLVFVRIELSQSRFILEHAEIERVSEIRDYLELWRSRVPFRIALSREQTHAQGRGIDDAHALLLQERDNVQQ